MRRAHPGAEPGITRRRAGKGWSYSDAHGRAVSADDRERITKLAIPPAWTNVWICPDADGHVLATGVDAAGRTQYLYHSQWQSRRSRTKFNHVREFAAALPTLREQVSRDLRARELTRDRVLAAATRLLDQGFFRIGSESYAAKNGTVGLATLRRRDVSVDGTTLHFCYTSKHAIQVDQQVRDPAVARVFSELVEHASSPRARVLAYEGPDGWHPLRSADINSYLKQASGIETASAKDFRTWSGTVICACALAGQDRPTSQTALRRAQREAVAKASEHLGNTVAVCRRSYVDPRVLDAFAKGVTVPLNVCDTGNAVRGLSRAERAVLRLLS